MTLYEKEYYIVSVELREVKAYDGHVLTHEGKIGWLGVEQGYPQVESNKRHAHKFDKPPDKPAIAKWDGMPWYYRIIPDSEIIYKVIERTSHEVVETALVEVPKELCQNIHNN